MAKKRLAPLSAAVSYSTRFFSPSPTHCQTARLAPRHCFDRERTSIGEDERCSIPYGKGA